MLCCRKSGISGTSVWEPGSAVSACGLFLDTNFFLVTEFSPQDIETASLWFTLAKTRRDHHGSRMQSPSFVTSRALLFA